MLKSYILCMFLVAIGLSVAGLVRSFYQWWSGEEARLRIDGETFMTMFGHILMSFTSGPIIMLHMGWTSAGGAKPSLLSTFFSCLISFGWALVIGLLTLSIFFLLRG